MQGFLDVLRPNSLSTDGWFPENWRNSFICPIPVYGLFRNTISLVELSIGVLWQKLLRSTERVGKWVVVLSNRWYMCKIFITLYKANCLSANFVTTNMNL
jgi:hypothetical protein